jgi:O-antigen ligase
LCLAFVAGLFGGFRGQFVLVAMLFVVQFFLEGLWRTWLLPVAVGLVVVCAAVVVGFSDRLPEGVQRSLSFLPVKIDPAVLENAESTTRWRLDLWQEVADQIPKYFWLGKGYGYSENDLYASGQMVGSRMAESYEFYITTSDFHSGPLSVLIPFGVFGCIAFLWFLGAGWWALWCNYRNGDPELRLINTFLLAYFTVRGLFFLTVFGALDSEFAVFAGAVGLSVALNRGVRKRAAGAVAGHEGKPAPRPAIFPRPVAGLYAGGRPFHTRGAARARALVPAKVYYRAKLE